MENLKKEILSIIKEYTSEGYSMDVYINMLHNANNVLECNKILDELEEFKSNVYLKKLSKDYYTFKYIDKDYDKIKSSVLDVLRNNEYNDTIYYYLYLVIKEEIIRFGNSSLFNELTNSEILYLMNEIQNNTTDIEDLIVLASTSLDESDLKVLNNGIKSDLNVIQGSIQGFKASMNNVNELIKEDNKKINTIRKVLFKDLLLGTCFITVLSSLLYQTHKLAKRFATETLYRATVETITEDGLVYEYDQYYKESSAGTYVYKDNKKYNVTTLEGFTFDDYLTMDFSDINLRGSKSVLDDYIWKIEVIKLDLDDYKLEVDKEKYIKNLVLYTIILIIILGVLESSIEVLTNEDHLLILTLLDELKKYLNEYKNINKNNKLNKEKLKQIKYKLDNIYNSSESLINSINERLDILSIYDTKKYDEYSRILKNTK